MIYLLFHHRKMTTDHAESKQDEFNKIFAALTNYTPKAQKYIEAKK